MAGKTFTSVRRRNVKPTSSVLRTVTRDFDCSAFTHPPEDGQFINCVGEAAGTTTDTTIYFHASAPTCTDLQASGLRMVWAHARQTDRQSLGDTKVPVLWQGGIEVECSLFEMPDDSALTDLASAANGFAPGKLLSVVRNTTAVAAHPVTGATDVEKRLVLTPIPDGNIGWAVGYVTKAPSVAAANGKSITVFLYDQPRKVGSF